MPSIFAVANPKGGSGKTTVAIILAGEFAKHGYSAAIIDADPQGSSYQWHASSVARGLSPQGVDLVRVQPDDPAPPVDRQIPRGDPSPKGLHADARPRRRRLQAVVDTLRHRNSFAGP